ncbi:methyltransferase domain-containing protein [candidate division GN15 bacterium]|nr:methyltransferase domain-containing protein [candidate division GN15 bacterium]
MAGNSTTAAPYQQFAEAYDQMGADRHSRLMADYTRRLLKRLGHQPADGLDLCCGTGTAIACLLDQGISMSGLDRSSAMLREAKRKLEGRGVRLYRQSLPKFEIKQRGKRRVRQYDLVTSFYDSLNYLLTERDLTMAFRTVYRHLRPGGLFIFDMNTPNALKTVWGAQTWAVSQKNVAWIFRNEFFHDTQSANCYVTIFVKEGRLWRRIDEVHTERGYSNAAIRRMLNKVGFRIRGFYRCFTYEPVTRTTNRICVIAQRKA